MCLALALLSMYWTILGPFPVMSGGRLWALDVIFMASIGDLHFKNSMSDSSE